MCGVGMGVDEVCVCVGIDTIAVLVVCMCEVWACMGWAWVWVCHSQHKFYNLFDGSDNQQEYSDHFTNGPPNVEWSGVLVNGDVVQLWSCGDHQSKCQHYHLEQIEQKITPRVNQ